MNWLEYPKSEKSTVVGNLKQWKDFYSPQLENHRDLLVYLPPSYESSSQRYPVLYMHDGYNLFDDARAFSREWQVDETLEELAKEGLEAIVVGLPNAKESRGAEYSPHVHSEYGGGRADLYLRFIVETVKPLIDQTFRTQPERTLTGLMGASMGGLISLYGFFTHPQTFGFAGVMSPAFWWTEGQIFPFLEAAPKVGGKIYMDIGGNETPQFPERRAAYWNDAHRVDQILREKGYVSTNYVFLAEPDGIHHESDWTRRLPDALRFLLSK